VERRAPAVRQTPSAGPRQEKVVALDDGEFRQRRAGAVCGEEDKGYAILWERSPPKAGMAELADAADSKSADRKVVGVRPPLPAPNSRFCFQIDVTVFLECAQNVPKSFKLCQST
jgi:hypothetical protein